MDWNIRTKKTALLFLTVPLVTAPFSSFAQTASTTASSTVSATDPERILTEIKKNIVGSVQQQVFLSQLEAMRRVLPKQIADQVIARYNAGSLLSSVVSATSSEEISRLLGPASPASSQTGQSAAVLGNVFTRNLRKGDKGEDVRILQKILNADPETTVAQEGPGSPGNETDFFGARTELAVVAFQNKNWEEVLAPAGLDVGTGFVGPLTRAKLNTLAKTLTF